MRACPACSDVAGAEARAVDAVLALVPDVALRRAYEASDGVCAPHLALALARGRTRPETAWLVAATLAKWRTLRETLARFIARHDHRNREPVAPEEARALGRALATLRGGGASTGPE